MTPFDYMKSMAELWGRGGKDFAAAQQNFFAEMAKATGQTPPFGTMPGAMPDAGGITQANAAFTKLPAGTWNPSVYSLK